MKGKSRSKKSVSKSELECALIKRALGYDATEVIEEYGGGEQGEVKLLKKKVTIKNVPPDMTALKILLDEREKDVSIMSDEELAKEKERLLSMLTEMPRSNSKKDVGS